jgi:hypothetical protein
MPDMLLPASNVPRSGSAAADAERERGVDLSLLVLAGPRDPLALTFSIPVLCSQSGTHVYVRLPQTW